MNKTLREVVDIIQFDKKLSLEQVAERIGYTRPYLSAALKKDTKGKVLISLRNEFPDTFKKYPELSGKQKQADPQDIGDLHTLIGSNSQLVNTNGKLTDMLQAAMDKIIAGDRAETQVTGSAITADLLEKFAILGVPKLWRTKEEGIAELGIRLAAEKSKSKKAGSVAGAGR